MYELYIIPVLIILALWQLGVTLIITSHSRRLNEVDREYDEIRNLIRSLSSDYQVVALQVQAKVTETIRSEIALAFALRSGNISLQAGSGTQTSTGDIEAARDAHLGSTIGTSPP